MRWNMIKSQGHRVNFWKNCSQSKNPTENGRKFTNMQAWGLRFICKKHSQVTNYVAVCKFSQNSKNRKREAWLSKPETTLFIVASSRLWIRHAIEKYDILFNVFQILRSSLEDQTHTSGSRCEITAEKRKVNWRLGSLCFSSRVCLIRGIPSD